MTDSALKRRRKAKRISDSDPRGTEILLFFFSILRKGTRLGVCVGEGGEGRRVRNEFTF